MISMNKVWELKWHDVALSRSANRRRRVIDVNAYDGSEISNSVALLIWDATYQEHSTMSPLALRQ